MAGLVVGRCPDVFLDEFDVHGCTGLVHGHCLDEVVPLEVRTSRVVRGRQRHRADLVDLRGRVAVRDAGDLVAALR